DNALVAIGELGADIFKHQRLVFRLLGGIGVAGVDHDRRTQAGLDGGIGGVFDTLGVVIGGFTAAQNDVAVLIAGGRGDSGATVLGDGEEMMRLGGREHGVERDLDVAVGAVLEADRAGKAGRRRALDLAFGGAGAHGSPGV